MSERGAISSTPDPSAKSRGAFGRSAEVARVHVRAQITIKKAVHRDAMLRRPLDDFTLP